MPKIIRCESCGEKKEAEDTEFSKWMGGTYQFFCKECKEELGLDDDY